MTKAIAKKVRTSGKGLVGRPTKFTFDRIRRYLEACRAGYSVSTCIAKAGWKETSLRKYRENARFSRMETKARQKGQSVLCEMAIDAVKMSLQRGYWPAAEGVLTRFDPAWKQEPQYMGDTTNVLQFIINNAVQADSSNTRVIREVVGEATHEGEGDQQEIESSNDQLEE